MYKTENKSRNNNQIILLISMEINTRRIREGDESVGSVQGVGSPSDCPWGAVKAPHGDIADGPLE